MSDCNQTLYQRERMVFRTFKPNISWYNVSSQPFLSLSWLIVSCLEMGGSHIQSDIK